MLYTLQTFLAQHWEQREQRSKLTEERHSRTLLTRRSYTTTWHMCMLRRETDMTRAHQHSLPARARARSMVRWYFRLFSRHISGKQSFRKNRHINSHVLIVQKPLVPLIGRLEVCSARTCGQTNRQTDRQIKYRNPRCACAPRVNNSPTPTYVYRTFSKTKLIAALDGIITHDTLFFR